VSNFTTNPDDLIWRGDALKAITGEPNDLHYPGWYIDAINGVPGAEQKVVIRMEATAKELTFIPNEPNWTPVSEGLPDPGERVIVTLKFKKGDGDGMRLVDADTMGPSKWLKWGDSALAEVVAEVIAWMPSPEPYSK